MSQYTLALASLLSAVLHTPARFTSVPRDLERLLISLDKLYCLFQRFDGKPLESNVYPYYEYLKNVMHSSLLVTSRPDVHEMPELDQVQVIIDVWKQYLAWSQR